MKKMLLTTALLLATPLAFAQYTGTQAPAGGYTGPTAKETVTSVKQAQTLRDDSYVTLRGKITKHLRKDKYLFSDGSGEITVEIDHKDWRGLTVGPEDTVEIMGEVDKDWNSVEIDVDRIQKVN